MTESTQQILQEALTLPPTERMILIDQLVASLDRPDPDLDKLWIQEAEARLTAYQSGELDAIPVEAVFEELADL
jgi:putative addiction module component (TIGR02574 family)